MDSGIVSVRYARALIKASMETHQEEQVYAEMNTLSDNFSTMPQLCQIIDNPVISTNEKAGLIKSVCGTEISAVTEKFISLILQEGREKALHAIANSYIRLYRQHKNIISGKLTTAVPVSEETKEKLRSKVNERTNGTVEFKTDIDPDIIGGFILEYDTYCMDASMRKKLNLIKAELKK
ncbi:MAG: F0F1 ATP synthase subunit delta [Bacteroidaceae bacterium]|jgi:F-type H+-transporting ATPase subunit delta|nr:F0F1 ATP synthase subunit delta [Bacteroidaceae bacterium]